MTQWRVGHQKRWKGAWQHSKAVFQSWQETKPVVRTRVRVHVRVSSPPSRAFHVTWCLFNTAGDFRKAACIALLPRVKAGRGQGDAGRQSSPATPFLYHSKGGYGKTTATATVEACLEAFIHRIGGGGGETKPAGAGHRLQFPARTTILPSTSGCPQARGHLRRLETGQATHNEPKQPTRGPAAAAPAAKAKGPPGARRGAAPLSRARRQGNQAARPSRLSAPCNSSDSAGSVFITWPDARLRPRSAPPHHVSVRGRNGSVSHARTHGSALFITPTRRGRGVLLKPALDGVT